MSSWQLVCLCEGFVEDFVHGLTWHNCCLTGYLYLTCDMSPMPIFVLAPGQLSNLCGSYLVEQALGRLVLVSLLLMTAYSIMELFFHVCVVCGVDIGQCPPLHPQTWYSGTPPPAVAPTLECLAIGFSL